MTCPAHGLAASRGFLLAEDVDLIRELAGLLPAGREALVIDLGAGSGTTALSVFAERSVDIRLITIDHDREALYWAGLAVENAGHSERWAGLLGSSMAPDAEWDFLASQTPIDLLLIDTSHEYEQTRDELRVWLPLMRPGCHVWMHDYVGEYPGVKRALDEVPAAVLTPYKTRGLGWAGVIA